MFVADFLHSLKTNYRPTRAERAVQTPIAPWCQHPIALSRLFAFVWIIYWHPNHIISVLCFHLLVFMNAQAALCSSTVLSVNISK